MGNLESLGIYDFNIHGILVKVMESHGKAMCFRKVKRKKDKKFGKITDKLKTRFNFSRNKQKHIHCILCIVMLENMLLNDCFDATVRTNALTLIMKDSERSWKRSYSWFGQTNGRLFFSELTNWHKNRKHIGQ